MNNFRHFHSLKRIKSPCHFPCIKEISDIKKLKRKYLKIKYKKEYLINLNLSKFFFLKTQKIRITNM